jgi:hypothetical protein
VQIVCPECNSTDIDCLYEIKLDPKDNLYYFVSKCNTCKHEGVNTSFWKSNGSSEVIRRLGEVNSIEKEIWEKKNV